MTARPYRRALGRAGWWAPFVLAAAALGVFSALGAPASPAAPAAMTKAQAAAALHPQVNAAELYAQDCSSCHGTNGHGSARAPSMVGVGEATVDFYLSTGRMPRRATGSKPPPYRAVLPGADVKALDRYVTQLAAKGGPAIPNVNPAAGDLAQGGEIFDEYCAACHSFAGRGGELTTGPVPELQQATPTQVGEAMRIGPGPMPVFNPKGFTPKQVDSIARYIQYTKHPDDKGGNSLGLVEPFDSGALTWVLVVPVVLAILRMLGKRDKSRAQA